MKTSATILLGLILCSPVIGGEIIVSAASSLTNAVKEISVAYKRINPSDHFSLNFASSGSLRGQIERGAPVDLYLSASMRHMNLLDSQNLLVKGSRVNFASNSLCLISPKKNKRVVINKLGDLIDPKVTRLSVGSPKSVPVGRYAKESLLFYKLWDKVHAKLIFGDNVRQVLDYVSRGEVDYGIVYKTDALIRKSDVQIVESISSTSHSKIIYPAAVIKGTKFVESANRFVQFLKSDVARAILVKYGFTAK